MDIFQDKPFPQTVPVIALEHTDASDNPEDSIDNYVYLIDDNGEFILVMWYYRGKINYKSLIGMTNQSNEGQVYAGRMKYHIIQILPKNTNILKRGNQSNTELNELKFKVCDHL